MLDAWSHPRLDRVRLRRLLVAGCSGAAILTAFCMVAARSTSTPPPPREEEDETVIDVALVETPHDEPPPPDEVPLDQPASFDPAPQAPTQPIVHEVTRVPENTNVAKNAYDGDDKPSFDSRGGGNGGGNGSGHGNAPAAPPPPPPPPPRPPPPPPPPPPKPTAEKLGAKDVEPPKCKKKGIDKARAKALNVEGSVVVTYTVTASGDVVNVKATDGPPQLIPLAIAAVQGWHCEPATKKTDGSPVQVTKRVPLTVTLQ